MLQDVHSSASQQLNIASFTTSTKALGPGTRAVIWVQGCPFRCPGCIAPGWIPFRPASIFTPGEILEKIDLKGIDGLTFSGGEPMFQAEGLASVAEMARKKKDLDIICFTGYRYEQLLRQPPNEGVEKLLSLIDVLIDGPYIEARNDSVGLRGSSNQRILHLTSRLKDHDLFNQKRTVEVRITDGEMSFVGIPSPAFRAAVDTVFRK